MESRGEEFIIVFMSSEGDMSMMPSTETGYDCIVLGKINQAFTIKMFAKNQEKPYAAKLFIDDQEVVDNKTFRKHGNFFGFKKGGGKYDRFEFKMPPHIPDVQITNKEIKSKGNKMGEIRIVFFDADEVWKNVQPQDQLKNGNQKDKAEGGYTQVPMSDSKNMQARSLSVGTGNAFQIPTSGFHNLIQKDGPKKGMVKTLKAKYDDPIDQIVIRYSHPATLIVLGLLNPLKVDQINHFPLSFVKNNAFILECFYQALFNQKMNSTQIKEYLENRYSQKINDMYPGGMSALVSAHNSRLEPLDKSDFMPAIQSNNFIGRFCTDPKNQAASETEDKHFLGRRDMPVREHKPRFNPEKGRGLGDNRNFERPKPERKRQRSHHESNANQGGRDRSDRHASVRQRNDQKEPRHDGELMVKPTKLENRQSSSNSKKRH